MKTFELYLDDGGIQLTGEIIKTPDPIDCGNTKWEINWEAGRFVFYGESHQLKAFFRKMTPHFIIGKEVDNGGN